MKVVPDRMEYTALGDRMLLLLAMRVALSAIVIAWSSLRPELLGMPLPLLSAVSIAYVVASILAEVARRRFFRRGLVILSVTLLNDGVFLAWSRVWSDRTWPAPLRRRSPSQGRRASRVSGILFTRRLILLMSHQAT